MICISVFGTFYLTFLIPGLQKVGLCVAFLNHYNKGSPLLHTIKASKARAVIVGPGRIYVPTSIYDDYCIKALLVVLLVLHFGYVNGWPSPVNIYHDFYYHSIVRFYITESSMFYLY